MAIWVAGIGTIALLLAGFAARDRILEEWWLYRLEHGDEEAQKAAAKKLGTLRSGRAIPLLVREVVLLEERNGPEIAKVAKGVLAGLDTDSWRPPFPPPPSVSAAIAEFAEVCWARNWAGQALVEIGPAAVRLLLKDLAAQSTTSSGMVAESWTKGTLSRILTVWGDKTLPYLRAEAYTSDDALRKTVTKAFRSLLHHPSAHTRRVACTTSEFVLRPMYRSDLQRLAVRDPDESVRAAAAEALRKAAEELRRIESVDALPR